MTPSLKNVMVLQSDQLISVLLCPLRCAEEVILAHIEGDRDLGDVRNVILIDLGDPWPAV